MAAEKLAVRETNPHDRREVNLHLTKRGRQFFQAIRRHQRHMLRNAVRGASGPTVNRWIKMLCEAADSMARADRAFEDFCMQCGAHADGTCVLTGGDADCAYLRRAAQAPRRRQGSPSKRRPTRAVRGKVTRAPS